MTIHREIADADARVLVKGVKGRHIQWASGYDGLTVEQTTLIADLFEVPRVAVSLLGDETVEQFVERMLPEGYDARLVHWPELDADHAQFPEAFGLAMVGPA